MKYICDCRDLQKAREGRGQFEEVAVDDDGVCLRCGHYALAFRELFHKKGGKFPSPTVTIENLYGETNNKRKRRLMENGLLYNEFTEINQIIDYWDCNFKAFGEREEGV